MGLVFKRAPRKAGIWLSVSKAGYHIPFAQGLCFDMFHVERTEQRFQAWSKQGWPYEPKDEIPCYMVKTSNLIKQ